MTTPTQLADLVQKQQIGEATSLEQQSIDQAVGDTDDLLAEVLAAAATAWVAAFGASTAVGAGGELTSLLRQVAGDVDAALSGLSDRAVRAITQTLPEAVKLGASHALRLARAAGHHAPGVNTEPGSATARALREARAISRTVDDATRKVHTLLAARPDRFPKLAAAVHLARTAVSRVRAAVAWLVHQAVDSGAAQVAERLGVGRLWVAEPDACVRCAAYSGQYAPPGEDFDGGRSFDPQQRGQGPDSVDGPPLHPHCRCRAVPWNTAWPLDLPGLLQRRAATSVAEGRAPASESQAARVRAARQVLGTRRLTPRAAARAREAIRRGRFPQPR